MPPTQSQADHDTDETAFVRFAQVVLRHAAGWAVDQAPPTVFQRRFEFVSTSEWHEPVVAVPNYGHWLEGHLEEIAALPEARECIARLWPSSTRLGRGYSSARSLAKLQA